MCNNNKGFTLIEFLVSIVILMVGLLGLLQTINVSIEHNLRNQYRNDATAIADHAMAVETATGFEGVQTTYSTMYNHQSNTSGFTLKNYSIVRSGTSYTNTKEVNYRVSWRYKGRKYDHTVSTIISKSNQ